MKTQIVEYYIVRLGFFTLFCGLLAWWEQCYPWRTKLSSRLKRWVRHLGLQTIGKVVVRLVFPFTMMGLALLIQEKQIGFFHQKPLSNISEVVLGVMALDLTMYLQHRLLHKNSWLWRFHRVHHVDREVDVSTGLRFHPLEELFSMGMKTITITFLGIAPLAVMIFEVLLNFATLYTHINVRLKNSTEKALRRLIITPGMHRIHHSDIPVETNSNFGFCLSWWDRFFRTYRPAAHSGESKLVMGLPDYKDPKYQTLPNMLLLPFNLKKLKSRPQRPIKTKFTH